MTQYQHPDKAFFEEHDLPLPKTDSHGTEDEIRNRLKPVKATNWRMQGAGRLVADTELGELVQHISTDYICMGTDKNGMPILKKIN